MSLKILSITKVAPAAPYGDATRKRPLDIVVELPDSTTETFRIHENHLDGILQEIKQQFQTPDGALSSGAILAILWGLWKHRKRGASLASILNVDIEQ